MKQVSYLNPFGRFCCTIGNLPSSYMESLTYEQQLLWFLKFLDEKVIPAVNTNADAIVELQNYLKNLDLQDEVNNKLDEMAESGQLTDIIAQYLQLAGLLCFNTKADLKAAQNLVDGSFAKTFGTTAYNDGYGYFYKIRTLINTDVIDDDNLVALTNYPTLVGEKIVSYDNFKTVAEMKSAFLFPGKIVKTLGFYSENDGGQSTYLIRLKSVGEVPNEMTVISLINNNLVAELNYNSEINIMQLGAKRWDGVNNFDNKSVIDTAISLFHKGGKVIIPEGKFFTSGNHIIDTYGKLSISGISGIGGFNDGSCIELLQGANYLFWVQNEIYSDANLVTPIQIDNLHIIGNNTAESGLIISDRFGCIIKDVYISDFTIGNAIKLYNYNKWTEGTIISNVQIRRTLSGITTIRNLDSATATESFFNTQLDHVLMSFDINNSILINSSQFKENSQPVVMLYSWNIDVTCWFNQDISNNYIIYNYYNSFISGNAHIVVDGLKLNEHLIFNFGNGIIDLKGSINYNSGYGLPSISATKFIDLISEAPIVADGYMRGRSHFEGARIFNGERISTANANTVIYKSGYLPANQTYRLCTYEESGGVMLTNVYLITTSSVSFAPFVTKLTSSNTIFSVRPLNNYEPGSIHLNEGTQFEIYCNNIDSTVPLYFTLEMV